MGSGIGAAVGSSYGGTPGAIAGGAIGGAIGEAIDNIDHEKIAKERIEDVIGEISKGNIPAD
ncbi:hypothetical protein MUW69_001098 [Rodentibacter heylii]|nr:hypothetical protein [Rodentibacter heylii]